MLKCENRRIHKILNLKISTILAIISIFLCSSEETKIGKIQIRDGLYLAKEYQIVSTIKNNPKKDSQAKICVINSREDYEKFCKPFVKIYYDKWVR